MKIRIRTLRPHIVISFRYFYIEWFLLMNEASLIQIPQLIFGVLWLIVCWHSSQKNIRRRSKLASFLFRWINWAILMVNSSCWLINWSHHPLPTASTDRMEPSMQRFISEAFCIIISCPTGIHCFCMERAHCTKSFSVAYPSTEIRSGPLSATFSLFVLHCLANIRHVILY